MEGAMDDTKGDVPPQPLRGPCCYDNQYMASVFLSHARDIAHQADAITVEISGLATSPPSDMVSVIALSHI